MDMKFSVNLNWSDDVSIDFWFGDEKEMFEFISIVLRTRNTLFTIEINEYLGTK